MTGFQCISGLSVCSKLQSDSPSVIWGLLWIEHQRSLWVPLCLSRLIPAIRVSLNPFKFIIAFTNPSCKMLDSWSVLFPRSAHRGWVSRVGTVISGFGGSWLFAPTSGLAHEWLEEPGVRVQSGAGISKRTFTLKDPNLHPCSVCLQHAYGLSPANLPASCLTRATQMWRKAQSW